MLVRGTLLTIMLWWVGVRGAFYRGGTAREERLSGSTFLLRRALRAWRLV